MQQHPVRRQLVHTRTRTTHSLLHRTLLSHRRPRTLATLANTLPRTASRLPLLITHDRPPSQQARPIVHDPRPKHKPGPTCILATTTHNPGKHTITHNPALIIVVGAHPTAERNDRPIAAAIAHHLHQQGGNTRPNKNPTDILTLTDLWYLNDPAMRATPTISVGPPEHNALTASLTDRVPTAFVIDDRLCVQIDPELLDPIALIWGVSPKNTQAAAERFLTHHADHFLSALN